MKTASTPDTQYAHHGNLLTGCPCKLFGIYQPIALFLCFKALIRRLNVVADELSSARSFNEG
jgi:hypothetical protein